MRLGLRRKQKKPLAEERITEVVKRELDGFITLDDVKEYLEKIKKDERKRRLWDSMSNQKKLKLLRYIVKKKGVDNAKK